MANHTVITCKALAEKFWRWKNRNYVLKIFYYGQINSSLDSRSLIELNKTEQWVCVDITETGKTSPITAFLACELSTKAKSTKIKSQKRAKWGENFSVKMSRMSKESCSMTERIKRDKDSSQNKESSVQYVDIDYRSYDRKTFTQRNI